MERLPSWLVLHWDKSSAADGSIPQDATWTVELDDPHLSRDQARLIQVSVLDGGTSVLPGQGRITFSAHNGDGHGPVDDSFALRIGWPDNMPESINFRISLTVQDGRLRTSSSQHKVRVWKALRSTGSDLPSVTRVVGDPDALHYAAGWLGGPGPIHTNWTMWEGLTLYGPYDRSILVDPNVTGANPWLLDYLSLPWFQNLVYYGAPDFCSPNPPQTVLWVGVGQQGAGESFVGEFGTYRIPVSLSTLSPVDQVLADYYGTPVTSPAVCWAAIPIGGTETSLDPTVSSYTAGIEAVPGSGVLFDPPPAFVIHL